MLSFARRLAELAIVRRCPSHARDVCRIKQIHFAASAVAICDIAVYDEGSFENAVFTIAYLSGKFFGEIGNIAHLMLGLAFHAVSVLRGKREPISAHDLAIAAVAFTIPISAPFFCMI